MKSAFWDECRSHNTPFPGDKSLFSGWHGSDKDAESFFLFFVNGRNGKHCFFLCYHECSVAIAGLSRLCRACDNFLSRCWQNIVTLMIIFCQAFENPWQKKLIRLKACIAAIATPKTNFWASVSLTRKYNRGQRPLLQHHRIRDIRWDENPENRKVHACTAGGTSRHQIWYRLVVLRFYAITFLPPGRFLYLRIDNWKLAVGFQGNNYIIVYKSPLERGWQIGQKPATPLMMYFARHTWGQ